MVTPRNQPLWIRTSAAGMECPNEDAMAAEGEPVSPSARAMKDIYIVVSVGIRVPVNLALLSARVESELLGQCPRFRSIQVLDQDGEPRWVRTPVNLEDHIIVVPPAPAAVDDPDQAVEDYVASLSRLPMDTSRPLWELHLLDFPTSEAASTVVIRMHHSLGDGTSLLALFMASGARRDAAGPPQATRTGAIYAQPRPPLSAGAPALAAWIWSYFVLAWHTVVDVSSLAATVLFLKDPPSPFKREDDGGEFHRKRFVHASLSLDDVKFLKKAMKCTVNDVLVGVTCAALSRYYFRKTGENREICFRSILAVSTRPINSLQTYANMIASGKSKDVTWGNRLGQILLPFHLAMHDDPLEYIRKAKKVCDRKKSSLEVIFTQKITDIFLRVFGPKAGGFIFHRMFANTTLGISNMIGPSEQIELFGHPVAFIAPSVYGTPEALVIHYQSYMSTIKVVLSIDEDKFLDYRLLLDDFVESLRLIKNAASRQ